MSDYLSRYLAGEHEDVWAELLALKATVRKSPDSDLAAAVAAETMLRVRNNLQLLIPRLEEIGYKFGDLPGEPGFWKDYQPLGSVAPDTGHAINIIQNAVGMLPISYAVWHRVVGSVSLLGYHPDWPAPELLDPLHVDPIAGTIGEYAIFESIRAEIDAWNDEKREFGRDAGPFVLTVAPDALHKANISGGMPYTIALPCKNVDAKIRDEPHRTTFVNYLRECLKWGGFPGFAKIPTKDQPTETINFLTKDFLQF